MITISNSPTEVKLIIAKGKTFGFSGTFSDLANITDWIFRLYIRRSTQSTTTVAAWSVASGHITVFGTDKRFTLLVPAVQTAALPSITDAKQEFEAEQPDGNVIPLWSGPCDITGEVSR